MVEFIENHQKTFKIKLKIPKSENDEEEDKKVIGVDNLDDHKKIQSKEKVCQVCKKVFGSGKALGGHMRIHFQDYKKNLIFKKKNKKILKTQQTIKFKKFKKSNVEPTCALCGKIFPSMKSLFGHMRCHPEREWRGIRPPSPLLLNAKISTFSSSTSSDIELVNDDLAGNEEEVFEPENLLDVLPRWSVTAKRGRKAVNRVDDVVEEEFREAVDDLMMLAKGGGEGGGDSCDDQSFGLSQKKNQKVESFEVINGNKDTKLLVVENDQGLIIKKKKERKKMKLRDLDQIQDYYYSPPLPLVISPEKKHKCSICGKCFPTHQALGGHKSSHHKFRLFIQNSIDDDHHQYYSPPPPIDTESPAKKVKKKSKENDERVGTQQHHQHLCKVRNKIISPLLKVDSQSISMQDGVVSHTTAGRMLDFDLNELPPVEEDDIDDEAHHHAGGSSSTIDQPLN